MVHPYRAQIENPQDPLCNVGIWRWNTKGRERKGGSALQLGGTTTTDSRLHPFHSPHDCDLFILFPSDSGLCDLFFFLFGKYTQTSLLSHLRQSKCIQSTSDTWVLPNYIYPGSLNSQNIPRDDSKMFERFPSLHNMDPPKNSLKLT